MMITFSPKIPLLLLIPFAINTTLFANEANSNQLTSNQAVKAPMVFSENNGQVTDINGTPRPDILFTTQSNGAKLFITATGINYQFAKTNTDILPLLSKDDKNARKKTKLISTHRFTLSLAGANQHPKIRKEQQGNYIENFYLGHCPQGITGVKTYGRIIMEDVYPGIDWVIYTTAINTQSPNELKYDFVVHPGANPANIKLQLKDADAVSITPAGEMSVKTTLGEIRETASQSFISNGQPVATAFKQVDSNTIGFDIASYDSKQTLTIDPRVIWATYYAQNTGYDDGRVCTVDGQSNVYLTGITGSAMGIAAGGFQNTYGGGTGSYPTDAYLVKFDSNGTRLWATYYGGSDNDDAEGLAADSAGNVYMAGGTYSSNAIASGGYRNTYSGNGDAFLVKFGPTGTRIWGTYFGSDMSDAGAGCAIDKWGNIYLAGSTLSDTGISLNGYQNIKAGNEDGYLARFNSAGSLLWATYFGGSNYDFGNSCTTDNAGNVFLAGQTYSNDLDTTGSFQSFFGGFRDAFLVKFDSVGTRLWSTYYGSTDDENGRSCTTDMSGNVYLAGGSTSQANIASGGFQNTYSGNKDAFMVKFNSTGTRLWATYYGGSKTEDGYACAADHLGNVYLAGYTYSDSNIAYNGFQNALSNIPNTSTDAFLVKFDNMGNRIWSTYYGGPDYDYAYGCAVDNQNHVYLSGNTSSPSGIATSNGFHNTYVGGFEGFLAKIIDADTTTVDTTAGISVVNKKDDINISLYPNPNTGHLTLSVQNKGYALQTSYQVNILNTMGIIIHSEIVPANNSLQYIHLSLENEVPNGIYFLQLNTATCPLVQAFYLRR